MLFPPYGLKNLSSHSFFSQLSKMFSYIANKKSYCENKKKIITKIKNNRLKKLFNKTNICSQKS